MHYLILVLILALIQGLCEFLPISSSGHLVIAQNILGLTEPEIFLDLVLHVGTLGAVIIFYRRDLLELLLDFKNIRAYLSSKKDFKLAWQNKAGFRLGLLVALASLPTAIIGLLTKDLLQPLFASVSFVGGALLFTGLIIYIAGGKKIEEGRGIFSFRVIDALIIGTVQGLAIAPGISRSGMTISAALFLGLSRELGAKFSFILSIPVIIGAFILESRSLEIETVKWLPLFFAMVLAGLVGYGALKFLIHIIKKGSFKYFAYWCWLVGSVVLTYNEFF